MPLTLIGQVTNNKSTMIDMPLGSIAKIVDVNAKFRFGDLIYKVSSDIIVDLTTNIYWPKSNINWTVEILPAGTELTLRVSYNQ